jgi:hypothetical protein
MCTRTHIPFGLFNKTERGVPPPPPPLYHQSTVMGLRYLVLSPLKHLHGFTIPRFMPETLQGYLAQKKTPISLGPPYDPRNRPTVGS